MNKEDSIPSKESLDYIATFPVRELKKARERIDVLIEENSRLKEMLEKEISYVDQAKKFIPERIGWTGRPLWESVKELVEENLRLSEVIIKWGLGMHGE
jgi:predicted nuclease with TOPRIM domain